MIINLLFSHSSKFPVHPLSFNLPHLPCFIRFLKVYLPLHGLVISPPPLQSSKPRLLSTIKSSIFNLIIHFVKDQRNKTQRLCGRKIPPFPYPLHSEPSSHLKLNQEEVVGLWYRLLDIPPSSFYPPPPSSWFSSWP